MSSYRALKAKEVELTLLGLQERLAGCPRENGTHAIILARLDAMLIRFAAELESIKPVAEEPAFQSAVDFTLGRIIAFLSVLDTQFIRGLVNPSDEELYLRSVFLGCARRLGLDWFEDMVVQSSGSLGIYTRLDRSFGTPVLHVPPSLLDRFLSLPGVYHEFGHSVFEKFPRLLAAMQQQVREHFDELRRGIGPVQQEQREAQMRHLQAAEMFWNERRLGEIFCDLFGQFVSGSANFISMIDLALADGLPPYDLLDPDYPPNAARVQICAVMLSGEQTNEPLVSRLLDEWSEFTTQHNDGPSYRDTCSEALLRRIALAVFDLLPVEMPNLPRTREPLPDVQVAFTPVESLSFEEAVQRGFAVFAWNRENFDSWWSDARPRLR